METVLDIKERLKKTFFKLLKLIPQVRRKIDTEMNKVSDGFENDVKERTKHLKYITRLPEKGLTADQIIKITDENLGLGKFLSYLLFSTAALSLYRLYNKNNFNYTFSVSFSCKCINKRQEK